MRDYSDLRDEFLSIRTSLGDSQEDVALAKKVHRNTISKFERRPVFKRTGKAVKVAREYIKVSQWLGHRDFSTTQIYAHLAPQDADIDRAKM